MRRREEPTLAKRTNPLLGLMTEHATIAIGARVYGDDVVRIGSHPSNELVLDDATVSRFHCRLTRENGRWRLTDSGSLNGTRLDGVRVLVAEVEREATLTLGDTTLRLVPGKTHTSAPPPRDSFGALVGASPPMLRLFEIVERVAASDIDTLVLGESGTGKELVATEIIQRSARADGPLVVVDCGAISPSLVESELFGHVRGAFTGADREREGAFEAADGGTLFLDEIGELPLELQPKLLRALENREVRRVGQNRGKRVDVRVIAATNRDLEPEVNRGRFREDLYYRLAKLTVRIPPLRERLDDVPLLARAFLQALGRPRAIDDAVLADLARHDWPGNVRELRNHVERSLVLSDASLPHRSGTVRRYSPEEAATVPFKEAKEAAIAEFEKSYLEPLLTRTGGNFSKAARDAKMDRMYLHQLAQKHGLDPKRR
ncbi:MAG: sigma 54-dependent Fis family transcriptional regulator [Labilithrix sp.]|nr:sigma 54-dependent Fis family transcriptional regulator [Labilithrix sp.]MCW5815895.1 sigma 54-dependent Fis family transcriptional regulator [Labilithrix sp.]